MTYIAKDHNVAILETTLSQHCIGDESFNWTPLFTHASKAMSDGIQSEVVRRQKEGGETKGIVKALSWVLKVKKRESKDSVQLIVPSAIKYDFDVHTNEEGALEGVLTRTVPHVVKQGAFSDNSKKFFASDTQELLRLSLTGMSEFTLLSEIVKTAQSKADVPYQKALQEYQLFGWEQKLETLSNLHRTVDDVHDNIVLNEGLEQAMNDYARDREREREEIAMLD